MTGDLADGPQIIRPPLVSVAAPGRGYRNFLGNVPPGQQFSANKLFQEDGTIDDAGRRKLHARMALLSGKIREQLATADNPNIPSGYAYLLQFIAHDVVDSVISWTAGQPGPSFSFSNARHNALCLDTLYGSGPGALPHVYAPSSLSRAHPDSLPRTRLRLGPVMLPRTPVSVDCMSLARDIARGVQTSDTADASDGWRTHPLLADARNDAHALISQLTALFHTFHNIVMDLVDPPIDGSDRPPTEVTYQRFLCARMVVTVIYRSIILNDILPRILHTDVLQIYFTAGKPNFSALQDDGAGIPIEFSHGAFRFAHAMSRNNYVINSTSSPDISGAFTQTSSRSNGPAPLTASWVVDWSRFFKSGFQSNDHLPDSSHVNLSNRIQPRYPIAFFSRFEAKNNDRDVPGLADRDLLSSCYARGWSVGALCTAMSERELWRLTINTYDEARQSEMASWLDLGDEGREIAADPPLPFYFQFEAMKVSGGLRLGPVGSIIVAETVLGAMKRNPLNELGDREPSEQITQSAKDLLITSPHLLDDLAGRNIDSMPKLLAFLRDMGAFVPNPH